MLDKYQVIFIHKQVSFFCHPTVTQKRLNLFSLFLKIENNKSNINDFESDSEYEEEGNHLDEV